MSTSSTFRSDDVLVSVHGTRLRVAVRRPAAVPERQGRPLLLINRHRRAASSCSTRWSPRWPGDREGDPVRPARDRRVTRGCAALPPHDRSRRSSASWFRKLGHDCVDVLGYSWGRPASPSSSPSPARALVRRLVLVATADGERCPCRRARGLLARFRAPPGCRPTRSPPRGTGRGPLRRHGAHPTRNRAGLPLSTPDRGRVCGGHQRGLPPPDGGRRRLDEPAAAPVGPRFSTPGGGRATTTRSSRGAQRGRYLRHGHPRTRRPATANPGGHLAIVTEADDLGPRGGAVSSQSRGASTRRRAASDS